jgi:ADP-heptose:LPS heptosyltransferase
VNLQYGNTEEESGFSQIHGHPILQDERLDLFADLDGLTSLIDVCDLIVTTSNVTAHLAGALGKETQLLLPNAEIDQHWYWHSPDSRSLWYPSVHRVSLSPLQDHNAGKDHCHPSC